MPNFKPALISVVVQGSPVVGQSTIDVYAVSQDGSTVKTMNFQNGVSTSPGVWEDVVILGGPLISAPAVATAAAENAVFALQQNSGNNYVGQNDWGQGASQQQPLLANSTSGPAAAMHNNGFVSVLAVGSQTLYHVEFDTTRQTWSSPVAVDFQQIVVNSPPVLVVSGNNDRMDVFTLGTDLKLHTDRAMVWTFGTSWVDTSPTTGWDPPNLNPFQSLGGIFPAGPLGPEVASWGPNRLDVCLL